MSARRSRFSGGNFPPKSVERNTIQSEGHCPNCGYLGKMPCLLLSFTHWLVYQKPLSCQSKWTLPALSDPAFLFFFLINLFLAALGLRCCVWAFFLVAVSGGYSSLPCAGLSLRWPLSSWSTGSRCAGSVVVAHGLSCSAACGIFLNQGSNPCPLHWQADS